MSGIVEDTIALIEARERLRFEAAAKDLVDELKRRAPEKTGETIARTGTENAQTSGPVWSIDVVSRTLQARLTDEGTGLFGPKASLIKPVVARALHWIGDGGEDVFARSSKGSGKHKGWFSDNVARFWPIYLRND